MKKLFTIVALLVPMLFIQTSYSAQSLAYPADCKNKTLENAAKKNGCSATDGGNHWKVVKNGAMITTIPYSVKENDTCRATIKMLNSQC